MNEVLASKGFAQDLILTDTSADGLRLLASGQGEYAVVAVLPGNYIIRENKLHNLYVVVSSVASVRYGYAALKGNEMLMSRLSEGLAILRETGRYQAIHDKWLGVLETGKVRWETVALYAGAIIVPLLIVLGGVVLWTHILRKQVAQRTRSLSMPAKAFIIFLAAFVPCVINSYTGIRLTNPVLIRVAEIYGASNFETFRKIGVPSAIPMIFTGMKLSLNAAWTTLVAAELLAASVGLGFMIQQGRRLARPDVIIVGMLTIGLLGALMSWILTRIEARFASSRRLS